MTGIGTKAMIAGGLIAGGLGLAVHSAMGFNTAMAEVSTLVDTSTTDMNALTSQVRELSKEYGQMPVDTAKALYTTISAGYGDAADATVMLGGAMKLARGGITDTGTAIDGLTSIMNSYGMTADQVTGVSDQMFVAMKAGKTTIGELSSSLGKVTPLASAAGVGLDQLLSATSALTLGGLTTSEAVTSLRGVLAAVMKPTGEAVKIAESLGIEFSGAAVKSMGLAGWLSHVTEKTSGNQEAMSKLFGSVEAFSGVLALTGNQAGSFFEEFLGAAKHIAHWIISYRDKAYPTEAEIKKIVAANGKSSRMKTREHQYHISAGHGENSLAKEHIFICAPGSGSSAEVELRKPSDRLVFSSAGGSLCLGHRYYLFQCRNAAGSLSGLCPVQYRLGYWQPYRIPVVSCAV